MMKSTDTILIINGGSSGIKFAVYNREIKAVLSGEIEGIGTADAFFSYNSHGKTDRIGMSFSTREINNVADFLVHRVRELVTPENITAVAHRIVFGTGISGPAVIDEELLQKFRDFSDCDPEHFPLEIKLIENLKRHFPGIPQLACFDTDFHADMPAVAAMIPLPQRLLSKEIRRYGFHGISYSFIVREMQRLTDKKTADGKMILAHLGSGASVCAVKNGVSMDTSMGFSTVSGLPMSTRTGDLDPGVVFYIMKKDKINAHDLSQIMNHESGLAAISGTTGDMRKLLAVQHTDSKAAQAIEYFCYQTKKYIASYAAVLGGLETLVFSGGIGENSPEIRQRICDGLQFLGIRTDDQKNKNGEAVISAHDSKVCVRVMHTDEQLMMASAVSEFLALKNN